MRVIFLDVDGVLNADCDFGGRSRPNPYVISGGGSRYCGICSSHVRELRRVVDRTDAKIVLVSSWKADYEDYVKNGHKNKLGKYLREKLRRFGLCIYDTTLKYDFNAGADRGYEIRQWLQDNDGVEA